MSGGAAAVGGRLRVAAGGTGLQHPSPTVHSVAHTHKPSLSGPNAALTHNICSSAPACRRTSVAGQCPVECAVGRQQAAWVRLHWVSRDVAHRLRDHPRRRRRAGWRIGWRGERCRRGRAGRRRRQQRCFGRGRHRRRRQQKQRVVAQQPLLQVREVGVVALVLACAAGGELGLSNTTCFAEQPLPSRRTCSASKQYQRH